MNLAGLAFRNLARHKTRSILSIFTIVIACIMGLFMLALITGMKAGLKQNILDYYTGAIQVRHGQYNEYDYLSPLHLYVKDQENIRKKFLKIEGVTGAVARISTGGKIYLDENQDDDLPGEKFNALAMGIDFAAEAEILKPRKLLSEGTLPRMGSRQAVLGRGLAKKTDLHIGDRFAFLSPTAARGVNAMKFEVTGLLDFPIAGMGNSYFLLPFDTMQGFLRMEGGAQEILLMTEDPARVESELEKLRTLLSQDPELSYLDTKTWKEQGEWYGYMQMATVIYNFFALFFLAFGATVIINSTMMAVFERYREIGILGAMGMKPKELVRLFFMEALFAGVISAVIGLSLGSVLVLYMEKTGLDFGGTFGGMNIEFSNVIYPDLRALHLLLMGLYTVGTAALVTLLPSRKAAQIEPVDAINSN